MSKFKETLQKDMSSFINVDEFAELHYLGEREVPIIIDSDELQKRQMRAAEGTYLGDLLLFVETKYFKSRPVEGRKFILDDKVCTVISCKEIDGLYEIAIGANESW